MSPNACFYVIFFNFIFILFLFRQPLKMPNTEISSHNILMAGSVSWHKICDALANLEAIFGRDDRVFVCVCVFIKNS